MTKFASMLFAAGLAVASFARADDDVLARLNSLSGVQAIESTTTEDVVAGLRRFAIQFEQPTDHSNASAGTFRQKLVLFHRGFNEPMVLQTSGYLIFSEKLSRVAQTFATNQLQVEHRYFAGSTPASKDMSKLNVRQSAEDFHRIVQAFKTLYTARWVNTGASKGGMTSVFHRRFFPNDLDGTVADVAPLSFSTDDQRYVSFVAQAGGDAYADCRAKLERLQTALLARRQELLPSINGDFTTIGSNDVALEHTVIELPFAFWQYQKPTDPTVGCDRIPAPDAPTTDLNAFLTAVDDPNGYTESELVNFQSYYYQAANELGNPASDLTKLAGLLLYPYNLEMYLPGHPHVDYTDATMLDVQNWVVNDASSIMFVYGEFDPWSAGAYPAARADKDNYKYFAPAGNHGSNFTLLADADKRAATGTIARWLGKGPAVSGFRGRPRGESLEDAELRILRKLHLR